jgi:hypothetical protein
MASNEEPTDFSELIQQYRSSLEHILAVLDPYPWFWIIIRQYLDRLNAFDPADPEVVPFIQQMSDDILRTSARAEDSVKNG